MKPFKYFFNLVFVMILLSSGTVLSSNTDLQNIITDIENASKVEQLYTCRMNLKRISSSTATDDPVTLALWCEAYQKLAYGFSNRNHFKNAADTYESFLFFKEKYLLAAARFTIDSLEAVHMQIKNSETSRIDNLDATIKELELNHNKVTSLKVTYTTWGTIISIILVIGFGYYIIKKQKQIKETQAQLQSNRLMVIKASDDLVDASLIEAGLQLSRDIAIDGISVLSELFGESYENTDTNASISIKDQDVQNSRSELLRFIES